MPGTKEGSKKAVAKILARNPNHFREMGATGGRNGHKVEPQHVESKPVDTNKEYTILSDGTLLGKDGTAKKPQLDKKGYLRVQVYVDGRPVTEKVHRLVARHFIPNPLNLPQVNHKDGDKTNNDISNLEWTTNAENMRHAVENNLTDPMRNLEAKRLAGQVLTAIQQRYILKDIAKKNGFSEKTINAYLTSASPEPITDLKLGRRRQLYYLDTSRKMYRVVKKDTGIESGSFKTEAEAVAHIDAQSSAGGFAQLEVGNDGLTGRERAKIAGARGGRVSKRKPADIMAPSSITTMDISEITELRVETETVKRRRKFFGIEF